VHFLPELFASKCPWEMLEGDDWMELLSEQPQFADKCDWTKLSEDNWKELLVWQPQLAAFKPAASGTEKTETRRHGD
jgi:hypothetical protein